MALLLVTLAAEVETVPATPGNAVDFTWLFLKMFLVLAIVCVFAILILKYAVPHFGIMKRFQRGKFFTVRARYHLDPRKALYLIQMGRRYLVIGAADHGISALAELTDEEIKELGSE